jgi:hypothetical protein
MIFGKDRLAGPSREATSGLNSAFLQGMRELGYVEGRDFVMQSRFADGRSNRTSSFLPSGVAPMMISRH